MLLGQVTDAKPDTWGIPGPTFLAYYGGAIVAAWILVVIYRRMVKRVPGGNSKDPGAILQTLDSYQLATINGGPDLALAMAQVQEVRLMQTVPAGGGPQVANSHPVELALADAHRALPGATAQAVRERAKQDPRVTSIVDDLMARGLITRPGTGAKLRLGALIPAAVLVVGSLRIMAGVSNGKPVGVLIGLVGFTAIVTLFSLSGGVRAGKFTALGYKVVDRARGAGDYRTYATSVLATPMPLDASAMFGVALFGIPLLATVQPTIASTLGVPSWLGSHQITMASGITSSSSSCSSSSSSCGGSSCGGSSCGGGGCGGGGCGG